MKDWIVCVLLKVSNVKEFNPMNDRETRYIKQRVVQSLM